MKKNVIWLFSLLLLPLFVMGVVEEKITTSDFSCASNGTQLRESVPGNQPAGESFTVTTSGGLADVTISINLKKSGAGAGTISLGIWNQFGGDTDNISWIENSTDTYTAGQIATTTTTLNFTIPSSLGEGRYIWGVYADGAGDASNNYRMCSSTSDGYGNGTKWYDLDDGINNFPVSGGDYDTKIHGDLIASPNASFLPPTPNSGVNVTTNQIINVSCTQSGNVFLYFDNNSNPVTLVVDNQTSPHAYTTVVDVDGDQYYYKAQCWNEASGFGSNTSIRNFWIDTVVPQTDASSSYSVVANTTLNISITYTDDHFYSANVTCPANNYNISISGLDVPSYILNISIPNVVDDTCSNVFKDGHTVSQLKQEWKLRQESKILNVFVTPEKIFSIEYLGNDNINYETIRERDRISYSFDFSDNNVQDREFIIYGGRLVHPSNAFEGWLVDDKLDIWHDFEGTNTILQKLNDSAYRVTFIDENDVITRSSGELNVVSSSFTIDTYTADTFLYNWGQCEQDNVQDMLMYIWLFILLLVVVIVNDRYIRMPMITFAAAIGFMIYSLSLFACNHVIAWVLFMFSFGVIAWGVMSLKK